MIINDMTIFLIPAVFMLALAAFIFFLENFPRIWKLVGYAFFCSMMIFGSMIYRMFDFISFNVESGNRAQSFFETLHKELTAGTLNIAYLEVPGTARGTVLSIIALLAVIGGGIVLCFKVRWFSYLTTFAAVLLAFAVTAFVTAFKAPEYIIRHNDMRKKSYLLIEQKRKENVSDKQISEAIKANLTDFRYTYENRKDENESSEKILNAIKTLQPETEKEK